MDQPRRACPGHRMAVGYSCPHHKWRISRAEKLAHMLPANRLSWHTFKPARTLVEGDLAETDLSLSRAELMRLVVQLTKHT